MHTHTHSHTPDANARPLLPDPHTNTHTRVHTQVAVSHPLLTIGSSGLSSSCLGYTGTADDEEVPSTRRLMQFFQGVVTSPARYSVTYQLNSSAPVAVGTFSVGAPVPKIRLTELQAMPDVSVHCMALGQE